MIKRKNSIVFYFSPSQKRFDSRDITGERTFFASLSFQRNTNGDSVKLLSQEAESLNRDWHPVFE
jgi:hypothetical protein